MAKKDFKSALNPALRFISQEPEPTTRRPSALDMLPEIQEESTREPARRTESKSRRLQLLIRPSTYNQLKNIADSQGTSVNDLINVILEKTIKED